MEGPRSSAYTTHIPLPSPPSSAITTPLCHADQLCDHKEPEEEWGASHLTWLDSSSPMETTFTLCPMKRACHSLWFRNYDQVRIPGVVPLDRIFLTPHCSCHLVWIISFRLFSKPLSNIHFTWVEQDGNQNGVPQDLKPDGCLQPIHPVF